MDLRVDKETNGPKNFFTSDFHFGHTNILRFHPSRREACGVTPEEFENDVDGSVRKHDEYLINLWNETIGKNDNVYYLGDLCFGSEEYAESILSRLNGNKHLIIGNHDRNIRKLDGYFEWTGQIREVKFKSDLYPYLKTTLSLELCHYPLIAWNRRLHGTIMLHGHTHGGINQLNADSGELRIDVGFDATGHKILEFQDIYKMAVEIVNRNHPEANTFKEYVSWKCNKDGLIF